MTRTYPRSCTRPSCAACPVWRQPAGCGFLASGTPCKHPLYRRLAQQAELPTIRAAVAGGEQLRLAEVGDE